MSPPIPLDLESFRLTVREFARTQIAPHVREWDAEERFGAEALAGLAASGLLGCCLPRAVGGAGLGYRHLAVLCEELERVDTFARVIISVHLSLNSLALYQWGEPHHYERWLRPQATGERVAAFALTEPEAGTDAASIATRAERVPGGYRLNGAKAWIGLAGVADHYLVFATLDPSAGHRSIVALLVEGTAAGLSSEPIRGKHGIRAGHVGRLFFENVFVPEADRLGREGEGFQIAMSALDNGRFSVAAGSVGIIEASLEAATARALERRTFSREIGRHQLVQQMLARMVAARDVGRLLVEQVAELKCRGVRHTREVSLAKWLNCDAAYQSANDAVQIFGAHGYSSEHPVERHLRNCRAAVIYEGTREIHQVVQAEYQLGYRVDRPLRRPLPCYPYPEDDGLK